MTADPNAGLCDNAGRLYVVGTPIGNLDDMTFRAIQTLKDVDAIASEDTRHTGKLLHHFQIQTPQVSYHQHNIQQRTPALIQRLQAGQNLAIVTDAGMPGISDPGVELIQACIDAEIRVVPIPGPVAAITGLVASGLPTARFCFEGFLPVKGQERRDRLSALSTETRTLVFYESPHRLLTTLTDLSENFGSDRIIAVTRELTKRFETIWRGSLETAITFHQTHVPKGEFTLIVSGHCSPQKDLTDDELLTQVQALIATGLSASQASRQLSQQYSISRRRIYQLTIQR